MTKSKGVFRPYYCRHCGKTVRRSSTKAWIMSFCEEVGKTVRLMRVVK